jgi:hypothetical protein
VPAVQRAEFLLQAEQVYQDYQAMYDDAFQERWDEMERRAREFDPQRLKRAFAEQCSRPNSSAR